MVRKSIKTRGSFPSEDPAVLLPIEVVGAIDDSPYAKPVVTRIEIRMGNGHRLMVTNSKDPTAIANLVRALEAV